MEDEIRFSWTNAERLLQLCSSFMEQRRLGDSVDLHDAASMIGQALGVDDVDKFAQDAFSQAMESGLGEVFEDSQAKEMAAIFAGACQPVMSLVLQYAQGEINPTQLIGGLNKICAGSIEGLQAALQRSLGIPDQVADCISGQLGSYTVSVYCFAAVFKIYQKAASDAQLAKERRIEVERLSSEAVVLLREQRCAMESLVSGYLLDRLEPFAKGMEAMDEAVLAGDDDGFIAANAQLWDLFGRGTQYRNALEFDDLMLSDVSFRL